MTIVAVALIAVGVGLLVGAAVGYWTAATDLQADRARVWADAYAEGVHDGEWRARDAVASLHPQPPTRNPYMKEPR